jgi:hypothetical protein
VAIDSPALPLLLLLELSQFQVVQLLSRCRGCPNVIHTKTAARASASTTDSANTAAGAGAGAAAGANTRITAGSEGEIHLVRLSDALLDLS